MHYKILGDSTFSNHHPVSFRINLSNSALGGSSWKAHTRFLQEAKNPIKALWVASPPQTPFFTKLRKIIRSFKQFCLAKAAETTLEETRLRKYLEFWQNFLHFDTIKETTKANVKNLMAQLQNLVDRIADG